MKTMPLVLAASLVTSTLRVNGQEHAPRPDFLSAAVTREAARLGTAAERPAIEVPPDAAMLRRSGVTPGLKVVVYPHYGFPIRGRVLDVTDAALILGKQGRPRHTIPIETIRAICRVTRAAAQDRKQSAVLYALVGAWLGTVVGRRVTDRTAAGRKGRPGPAFWITTVGFGTAGGILGLFDEEQHMIYPPLPPAQGDR